MAVNSVKDKSVQSTESIEQSQQYNVLKSKIYNQFRVSLIGHQESFIVTLRRLAAEFIALF